MHSGVLTCEHGDGSASHPSGRNRKAILQLPKLLTDAKYERERFRLLHEKVLDVALSELSSIIVSWGRTVSGGQLPSSMGAPLHQPDPKAVRLPGGSTPPATQQMRIQDGEVVLALLAVVGASARTAPGRQCILRYGGLATLLRCLARLAKSFSVDQSVQNEEKPARRLNEAGPAFLCLAPLKNPLRTRRLQANDRRSRLPLHQTLQLLQTGRTRQPSTRTSKT